MVHLTTVQGTFHGRVVAARLGAEGILTELRGAVDGMYPVVGRVDVWVDEDGLDDARALLLADAVEAAFDDVVGDIGDDATVTAGPARPPERAVWLARRRARLVWALVAAIVLVSLAAATRVV